MRVYAQVVSATAGEYPACRRRRSGPSAPTARPCGTGPQEFDDTGYTLQLCQPALAGRTHRHRRGGRLSQPRRRGRRPRRAAGAVLPPGACSGGRAKRWACSTSAASPTSRCCAPTASMLGFDCGPGNCLMDAWCAQHTGQAFDAGALGPRPAARCRRCWRRLLAEPYFRQAAAQEHRPRPVQSGLAATPSAGLRRGGAGRRAGDPGRTDGAGLRRRRCCSTSPGCAG